MALQNRRRFLSHSAAAATAFHASLTGSLQSLPHLNAADIQMNSKSVKFLPQIEPLVRLIEETPREKILETMVGQIKNGRPYRDLLSALFLAGIRNVQPRPNVGFKFHSVLVIHAAHQASMAAGDRDRWLPLLWAADYFKKAQADDSAQGDWTMSEPPNVDRLSAAASLEQLDRAMESWDIEAADRAATAAARNATTGQLFERFAKYGSRDFRDIGHKAIYVAGAFRLLDTIGHEHTEPIVRSLAFALLNHNGDPNPSTADLAADRPGKDNWELSRTEWTGDQTQPEATVDLLQGLRGWSPAEACKTVANELRTKVSCQSVYDALWLFSSELVARQNAIVPLHAVTSTNAIHYLYRTATNSDLRRWLVLQNTAFVCLFRDAAKNRGNLRDVKIDALAPAEKPTEEVGAIFSQVGQNRDQAAANALAYFQSMGAIDPFMRTARELVFCKGTDSHDYKFSSAMLEDVFALSPGWRARYIAGCSHLLHGSGEKDTKLCLQVRSLLS